MKKGKIFKLSMLILVLVMIFSLSAANAAETVTLRFDYWRMSTDPQAGIMKEIIKKFEEANPGIKIAIESTPQASLVDKLTTQILGGSSPDVTSISTNDIARFAVMNGLEPLDEYLNSDPEFKAGLLPQTMSTNAYNGKVYGLAQSFGCDALFYNRDLFRKAGLPDRAPKNIQEFIDFGTKLSALGDDVAGFALFGGKDVGTDVRFFELFWAMGVDAIVPEKKVVNIDTPAGIEAFQFIVDLHRKYKITTPAPTEIDYPTALRMFCNNQIGMFQANVGSIAPIQKTSPNLSFSVAPMIWKTIGAKIDGSSFTIANNSPHKKEAWQFIKYLMSFESIREWCVPLSYLPSRKDVMVLPEIQKNEYLKIYFDEIIPYAKPVPNSTKFNDLMEVARRELSMALLGQKTAEQAAKDASKSMREILK